jgi:tellurite resistance protein TehA-like permease
MGTGSVSVSIGTFPYSFTGAQLHYALLQSMRANNMRCTTRLQQLVHDPCARDGCVQYPQSMPTPTTGQMALGWVVWWLTALLFVLFSVLAIARSVFFPSTTRLLFRHPNQALFVGAVPMAFSTLTNGIGLFWKPFFGRAATDVAHAMFWVNLPAVLGCILLTPMSMFIMHDHGFHSMSAIWLLPVVPACVAASSAGAVALNMANPNDALVIIYLGALV